MRVVLCTLLIMFLQAPGPLRGQDARAIVRDAITAVGGESMLRNLRHLRLEGVRTERLVGVARDADMATLLTGRFSELRDLANQRARRALDADMVQRPQPLQFTAVVGAGGRSADAEEIVMAPERVLLTALDAPGLRMALDTLIDGVAHHVVTFGSPVVRLYIDATSHLAWGWRSVRSYPDDATVWAPWGDVSTLVRWAAWSLEPDGLRYPRILRTWRNGVPYRMVAITRVAVNPNVPADSAVAAPPPPPPAPRTLADSIAIVADGVVFVPGPYNVMLVRQDDGVVVLEAPHSIAYSALVLAEAARRFPDLPVKAVVVTSTAWPHVAGLREYIARGIPVHVAVPATDLVLRLAAAPHTLEPDAQQRARAHPRLMAVQDSVSIGAGANRVVLHRVGATGGERDAGSLLAWLPGRRFLFAGDLYVPQRFEPNFFAQAVAELTSSVSRLGLAPQTVVALHLAPAPWSAVLEQSIAAQFRSPQ